MDRRSSKAGQPGKAIFWQARPGYEKLRVLIAPDSLLPLLGRSLAVVAETEGWLVVEKPAFLPVHPSKPADAHTLWHQLRDLLAFELACGGQVSLINRLDRETSGIVLVAKTKEWARRFGLLMQQRELSKEYLAVVWGHPTAEEWQVDAPILRQGERAESAIYLKQMVHFDGAAACTRFRVEERFWRGGEPFSVVRAVPVTGRMHQIRLHLAHGGHPVVGDKIYGPDERCYLEFIETGWTHSLAARLLLARHALHSAYLAAPGLAPWRSELPGDLQAFVRGDG